MARIADGGVLSEVVRVYKLKSLAKIEFYKFMFVTTQPSYRTNQTEGVTQYIDWVNFQISFMSENNVEIWQNLLQE